MLILGSIQQLGPHSIADNGHAVVWAHWGHSLPDQFITRLHEKWSPVSNFMAIPKADPALMHYESSLTGEVILWVDIHHQ